MEIIVKIVTVNDKYELKIWYCDKPNILCKFKFKWARFSVAGKQQVMTNFRQTEMKSNEYNEKQTISVGFLVGPWVGPLGDCLWAACGLWAAIWIGLVYIITLHNIQLKLYMAWIQVRSSGLVWNVSFIHCIWKLIKESTMDYDEFTWSRRLPNSSSGDAESERDSGHGKMCSVAILRLLSHMQIFTSSPPPFKAKQIKHLLPVAK